MKFNPDTPTDDLVVLVVEHDNPRFGQIGKLLYHDWREYGMLGVVFPGGEFEEFYDGIMKGDSPPAVGLYYRHADEKGDMFDKKDLGPRGFKKKFLELEVGDIEVLEEKYKSLFDEDLA